MLTTHYHVAFEDGVWKVYKEGWTIPSTCADSEAGAIRCARSLAERAGGRVFVHGKEGKPKSGIEVGRLPAGSRASGP